MTRILSDRGERTWSDLLRSSAPLADDLIRGIGMRPGDRIVVGLENSIEHLELLFACWRLGARLVAVAPTASTQVFTHVVESLRPAAVAIDTANTRLSAALDASAGAGSIEWRRPAASGEPILLGSNRSGEGTADRPRADVDGDGDNWVAWLDRQPPAVFYTSGSTSRAKGVILDWVRMRRKGLAVLDHYDTGAADCVMPILPISHVYGLYPILGALSLGTRCVCYRETATPASLIDAVGRHRVSVILCPPPIATFLFGRREAREPIRSTLRVLSIGGAATSPQAVEDLLRCLPRTRLFLSYGLVETYSTVCCVDVSSERGKIGTVGPPRFDARGEIRDPQTGGTVGAGQAGELCLGGGVTEGYLGLPEANRTAFTADGLFRTGDLAVIDDDGYVSLRGRIKEMINAGGLSVDPSEIEEVLCSHEAVADCGVFGEEREGGFEVIHAAVALHGDPTSGSAGAVIEELYEYCAARLSKKLMPRSIVKVDRVPRGSLGKIARATLREMVLEHGS